MKKIQHYVRLLKCKDNQNNNRYAMVGFQRNKEKGMELP